MGVNRLKIGLFAVLMLVGVGAFAQNTMLRPASGKSGAVMKPKPKAQPPKTIAPSAAQPTAVQPASNTKKTNVFLENAETFSYDKDLMADGQLLKGNVRFRHDDAYLYCDSAYFFEERNSFNAYGHVRIVQGDTLFIYGDVLYYDGDTKMARLRKNVRMHNRTVRLTTDSLNYDRGANVGYYFTGGKLTDATNTLTSKFGYYYPGLEMALFRGKVRLTNPNFVMDADTLKYFTETDLAQILGPTTVLYEKETTIYSEKGWYDTKTEQSELLLNSLITHQDGKTLKGDTIFYDKKKGIGRAHHHVELDDTVKKVSLRGHYLYYKEEGDVALAKDSALMIDHSTTDTLYLNADTLFSYAVDSVDKVVEAFYNVRVFRKDVQAVCDSARYETRDSVLHLMKMPILWSDNQQITGDTIRIFSVNGAVERLQVINSAFVCQQEDSIRFNQLSGKEVTAYMADGELYRVDVRGNAQSLFFPREADSTMIGMNQTESSFLTVYLKKQKIDRIVLYPTPIGVMTPLDQVAAESMYLPNYSWQVAIRPQKWEDVFARPVRTVAATSKRRRRATESEPKETISEANTNKPSETNTTPVSSGSSPRPSMPNIGGSSSTLKTNALGGK
ncbi:MAG: OstA-like protein [Paludibacteraceae bacterium]|nr:OstA-like protein [Paludibacteraceae bacterium]